MSNSFFINKIYLSVVIFLLNTTMVKMILANININIGIKPKVAMLLKVYVRPNALVEFVIILPMYIDG